MARRIELDNHRTVLIGDKQVACRTAAKPLGIESMAAVGAMRIERAGQTDIRFAVGSREERCADNACGTFSPAFSRNLQLDPMPTAGESNGAVLRSTVREDVIKVVRPRILDRGKAAQAIVRRSVLERIVQARPVDGSSRKFREAQELDRVVGRQATGNKYENQRRRSEADHHRPFKRVLSAVIHESPFQKRRTDRNDDRRAGFASGRK